MSNKQEFPISTVSSSSSVPKKSSKLSNPYIEKQFLKNEYTRTSPLNDYDPQILKKPKPSSQFLKNYYNDPSMIPDPILPTNEPLYNSTLNFSKMFDDNLHDSFKFSDFQKEYRSEETLSLKSIEEYSSYDLTRNKSRFRNNNNNNHSKVSTIFQQKVNESLKYVALAFKTQIQFIQTLDQEKRKAFEFFDGKVEKIWEIFLGEQNANVSIDFNDFANIFKQLEIKADTEDIKLMFWRYGIEKIGLDFHSFRRYFTPMYRHSDDKRKVFMDEIAVIAKVLKMNLNFEYSLEMLRKEIKEKNVSLHEIFDKIAFGEEFLTQKNLKMFLGEYKIEVNDEDVRVLCSLYDPQNIGLTFRMFYQELLPKI